MKTISPRQLKALYWPSWNAAAKQLKERGSYSKEELEACRKDIHRQVTNRECSAKDLTNRQLDECLKKFAQIAAPLDGKRQVHLAEQPAARVRYQIQQIQQRLGLPDAYVEGIAVNMHRCGIAHCDEKQLLKVLQALRIHENRATKSDPS
ncbi:MAG: hypothetical protein QM680_01040 [Luteolibacter sp.]